MVLCGSALLVWVGSASADPISPASLLPALDVYVDSIVAGHAAAAVCAVAKSPARDAAGWQKAKAILVATLWANRFPIDFVRTVAQRLDAPPPRTRPNCGDPALAGEMGTATQAGWPAAIRYPLTGMDLSIVENPVSAADWARIKAAFAAEIKPQQRMFACVAVTHPELLPTAVHDWDQALIGVGQTLVADGLPRDEVSAQLSAAEANSLWHRVAPDAEAGLRDSCAKEKSWQDRLYHFGYLALAAAVDKLLPADRGDVSR